MKVMIVIYSAMVNLEGRVKLRKDLRTVTNDIQFILVFIDR